MDNDTGWGILDELYHLRQTDRTCTECGRTRPEVRRVSGVLHAAVHVALGLLHTQA